MRKLYFYTLIDMEKSNWEVLFLYINLYGKIKWGSYIFIQLIYMEKSNEEVLCL